MLLRLALLEGSTAVPCQHEALTLGVGMSVCQPKHPSASSESINGDGSALMLFRYLFCICLKNQANVFESTFYYTICLLKSSLSNKLWVDALVHSVLFSLPSQCVYVYLSNLLCSSCQMAGLRSQPGRGSCAIVGV